MLSLRTGWSGSATFAVDGVYLLVDLLLAIRLFSWDKDVMHVLVRGLQVHAVMFGLLVKAFQCGAAITLHVDSNHDITVFAGGLRLDDHVILVANVILDHRLALDHQGVGAGLLEFSPNL